MPDGLTLHYEERGDADSPAVVLLHDLGADGRAWWALARALGRDYRVILPDLPGHGLTRSGDDGPGISMTALAGALRATLDALDVQMAVLGGEGLGGRVALDCALAEPQRVAGVMLFGASVFGPPGEDAAACIEAEDVARRFGAAALGKRRAMAIRDPFLAGGLREVYAGRQGEAYAGALAAMLAEPPAEDAAARVTPPLLLCAGEREPGCAAFDTAAQRASRARVVVFKGAQTSPVSSRAGLLTDAVVEFLRDVEDGKPVAGHRMV